MRHAQAYFDRSSRSWVVGYYDSTRGGSAESYSTYSTQREAEDAADRYNEKQSDKREGVSRYHRGR